MDLLDYQKSGNAYGAEINPYPKFSLLKGKIPTIPGIYSYPYNFNEDLIAFVGESYYAFKHKLVTSNGMIVDDPTADLIKALNQGAYSILPGAGFRYDPFRQSVGCVPFMIKGVDLILLKNAWGPISGLSYNVPHHTDKFFNFTEPGSYDLPMNYRLSFPSAPLNKFAFSSLKSSPYGSGGGEEVIPGNEGYVNYKPYGTLYPGGYPTSQQAAPIDKQGFDLNLKVFDFKAEQYISIFSQIPNSPYLEGGGMDFANEEVAKERYSEIFSKHSLNFASLFVGMVKKPEGYVYSVKDLPFFNSATNFKSSRIMHFDILKSPYAYDRIVQRSGEKDEEPNPKGQHYEDHMVGSTPQEKNKECKAIVYQILSGVEKQMFEDCNYDVEPSFMVKKYTKIKTVIDGGVFKETVQDVMMPFPHGIPQKEGIHPYNTTPHRMFANVKPVYNYLNIEAENGFSKMHELSLPNVYALLQDNVADPSLGLGDIDPGENFLYQFAFDHEAMMDLYSELAQKGSKCTPFKDMLAASQRNKIMYFPTSDPLEVVDSIKKALPMYNEVSFDILVNANGSAREEISRTHIIPGEAGPPLVLKDFMRSLITLQHGPKAAYEVEKLKASELYGGKGIGSYPSLATINAREGAMYRSVEAMADYFAYTPPEDRTEHRAVQYPSTFPEAPHLRNINIGYDPQNYRFSLEKWFQYYSNFLNEESVFNAPIEGLDTPLNYGLKLIDDSKFASYYREFGDWAYLNTMFKAPSEKNTFGALKIGETISNLRSIFANNMRRMDGIFSKKPGYSEPLMYMIEKYDHEDNPIQTIFIPHFTSQTSSPHLTGEFEYSDDNLMNEPKIKKVTFIDSQVKYGKVYKYKIFQFRVVVGSQYRYVFANDKWTDTIAKSSGFGRKFDLDTLMSAKRTKYPDNPIGTTDAINPPKSFDSATLLDLATGTGMPGIDVGGLVDLIGSGGGDDSDSDSEVTLDDLSNPTGDYNLVLGGGDSAATADLKVGTNVPFETPFQYYSKTNSQIAEQTHNGLTSVWGGIQATAESMDSEDQWFDALGLTDKMAIFKSIIYPKITIEVVPYYEQTAIITDFPPIPPNVNFDPLIGKGSKMLLTFEHQTGDREEAPIVLQSEDRYIFDAVRKSQGKFEKKEDGSFVHPSIRFKSDDFPKAYQVFRLNSAPTAIQEFANNKIKTLMLEDATAYEEDFVPNVTYYYMFRTVDVHDAVSNPSPVYAVTMVYDSGVYYPIVEEYNFPKTEAGFLKKNFKQYLKIDASLLQKRINKEESMITDQSSVTNLPVLGIPEKKIWNYKKFKFRIRSKHTGKLIDLNVKYKTNHTEPEKPLKGC